jgi:hypothetical protein
MTKPPFSSAPPGASLPMTQQMEGSCNKHHVIKGEAKYPRTSWLMGNCKKQANLIHMENLGHSAILLRGTLSYQTLHVRKASCNIKSTITPLEVRTSERNFIMTYNKGKQAVHATSKHERDLIRELTRSWWHSCIKVSPRGDKFEGKPLIHHLSQSHRNFRLEYN